MTVIAGVIGCLRHISLTDACRRALACQRLYASFEPSLLAAPNVALGASAHEATAVGHPHARSPDGRFLLVADMRLDNREELLRSLGSTAASDCDIIVAAWSRWGEECIERIIGDFAIAIHDRRDGTLTLARDGAGQRPLFYGQRDSAHLFASMPSGILAGGQVQINLTYLANILAGIDGSERATVFRSIHKVLPGEIVTLTGTSVSRRLHWRPETRTSRSANRLELVEAYRSHLDEAVRCRIAAQGGVIAAHLSSGYDSAAVTATAARVKQPDQRLVAYTSAPADGYQGPLPRGRIGDESVIAAEVAAMHQIEHVIVRNDEPVLAALRGHARFHQEPAGDVLNLSWTRQIGHDAAALGARVLLTGGIGNYTLNAGGLPVLHDYVRRGQWLRWWREARAVVRRPDVRWRGTLVASFRPWLPVRLLDAAETLFNHAPAPSTYNFLRADWTPSVAVPSERGDYAKQRLATIRAQDPGAVCKARLAQTGVQECDPTADRRLIEFSLGLPPEQLLDRGIYRPLARAALADRLPSSVIDARHRGYAGADWFSRLRRDDVLAMIEEIRASPSATELIDLGKLQRAIEQWPSGDDPFARVAVFGRAVANALSVGIFLAEMDRYPEAIGV